MRVNRRGMLKMSLSGMAWFSAQATTPKWIMRSASALAAEGGACLDNGRILVILQQAGGNDSLNTVIPRTDPVYYDGQTRPTIRVPQGSEINLDGLNGFHPKLTRLANWYQRGNVGILQNVGYVNPNLSHFTSTDYYEYGFVPGDLPATQGWAARFYDNTCAGAADPEALFMAAAGVAAIPRSLIGITGYTPPAISDAATYALTANNDPELRLAAITALNSVPTADPTLDFIQRGEAVTEASIADIATATAQPDLVPLGSYSDDSFGNGLRLTSQIIRAGFKTRIFYVSQGGYDTHSGQIEPLDPLNAGDHPLLLDAFDRSLDAFLTEMEQSGNLDRVLIMSFSEFGRRVKENGSRGTDHGAAHSTFVFGGGVRGGVYGGQPDLVNLTNGNLKHTIDFRSIYSRVVQTWFGAQAAPIFGQAAYETIIAPQLPSVNFLEGGDQPTQDQVRRHLLGIDPSATGLDANGDSAVDAADLLQSAGR